MKTLQEAYQQFDIEQLIQTQLAGTPTALNAYEECCGRYTGTQQTALIWEGKHGQTASWTFDQLAEASGKLANYFTQLGLKAGDCIAGLLPRTAELLITVFATWRIGAVYQPLFTAFESKAIEHRIQTAKTQLIVTNTEQRPKLNALSNVKILTVDAANQAQDHDTDFWQVLSTQDTYFETVYRSFEDDFLMMFTSGTTGLAKSVPVPLKAIVAFKGYMQHAVDLRAEDSFWNLADPGWAYGLYYGITGPLSLGHSIIMDERPFSVDHALEIIRKYQVSNLTGSPTAFRMFFGFKEKFDGDIQRHLRVVSSAGEPLTPEVIHWFKHDLQVNIYDQYGQTELGMVIANHHALEHQKKVGSAGYAIPGHRFAVLNAQHQEVAHGEIGTLALDESQSPLMWFKGYDGDDRKSFVGQYYLTGDTVRLNEFGGIDFIGRADDVITTSGYRVGPFDVESTLLECEEVLESAVIGKPDPERTEVVKAFVVLKNQYQPSTALQEKLQQYVRSRLSKHAYPKEIEFVSSLPKTSSGKIQRNLLKQQEIAKQNAFKKVS
ncbi:AMP-binding protein [Acinetobacter towneri]|uniref:AMP-binding protein n=1 Tax=Acinetobacter towneri TaxID=202956 RepID=A0AB35LXB6_9GAMM|nr:AMP-binding protein [Acinetobacter towneri]MDM1717898.1 AMP-binding protein [Acinetobacter towneri]MDM1729966.1 AMP-binding protein [Acinetobacter towneri]MDM1732593.1 AMP-binding protein [Acinetobacter towneri]MDM1736234.1 AMP-binding protein [Acinetobacter towneri]MDM1737724.1 AMP-binding protein [Acinetobacter towneri]